MAEVPEWETTVEKAIKKLRDVLDRMHTIWKEIGITEQAQVMYRKQAYKHLEDLLNDMVAETEVRKDRMLQDVQQLMEQISTISKELGTEIDTTGYEHLSLKDVEQVLRTDLNKLQYRKEQRMEHLRELLSKEQIICKILGTQPIGIHEHFPSEEELSSFKLYLENQENEKNRLESIFNDMRRSIMKMMDDLGISPSHNLEHLVYEDPDNFVYSTSNMTKLRELRDQLKAQVEEAKQHVHEMRHELVVLWKFLDEPQHICDSFLNSYVGYSVATINCLSTELKRCKDKRTQNIAKYVLHVRGELERLWDLCKYGENQRKTFTPYNSQTYTEDLLTLHELEVERLQMYYKNNKPIFELLIERENLWSKMRELLRRANDPDRFHNRGGQLLIEEKERKTIQKKVPKIEEQLRSLIKEYEDTHGEIFTMNGMSIDEILQESWENLNEEKETIKKARQDAKNRSTKKATLSASRKGASATTSRYLTSHSASKRKMVGSPALHSSTKRRNVSVAVNGSTIRSRGKVSRRLIPTKATKKGARAKENSQSQCSTVTDTTYGQFMEHLEDRRELRSSLLPEQVLSNAIKATKLKTPVRTPAKPLRRKLQISTPSTPKSTSKSTASQSGIRTPRSPRLITSTRLAPATTPLPIIF